MATARRTSTHDGNAHPWMAIGPPSTRQLQVYALDPSVGSYSNNRTTLAVTWEPLQPGPCGARVAVIDYDAANKRYYAPVDLDDPLLLARQGMDPSESEPRFHQQMVYAVASRTIEMFDVALGRTIHWRRADRSVDRDDPDPALHKKGDIWVLNLYPHAIHEANAYYSPQAHGIVFGYFSANLTNQGRNLPGQRIFTCLSHDIIAHEITHAVIDGIRTYFTEPTNPDVLAFHEGFADLCALFSHFSLKDALVDTIRRTGGRLYASELTATAPAGAQPTISAEIQQTNPLIQLALQFGEARGVGKGLRSAIGTPPNSDDIRTRVDDPHFRGSILVSAVFDAYFSVYMRRAEDLFEIHRNAGGGNDVNLPPQLAEELAATASRSAVFFFRLCARALDYCPPVDVTFGDFLRAMITVARDLQPDDEDGVRDSLMEAFRLRGIFPEGSGFFSEDALSWPRLPRASVAPVGPVTISHPVGAAEVEADLVFGSPNGLTRTEKDINGRILRAWATKHRRELGLDPELAVSVPSFHPVYRTRDDGRASVEMIVEVVQTRTIPVHPDVPEFGALPFRGGVTLVIDGPELGVDEHGASILLPPEVRYIIGKAMVGPDAEARQERQRGFAVSQGFAFGVTDDESSYQANFALLHEER